MGKLNEDDILSNISLYHPPLQHPFRCHTAGFSLLAVFVSMVSVIYFTANIIFTIMNLN